MKLDFVILGKKFLIKRLVLDWISGMFLMGISYTSKVEGEATTKLILASKLKIFLQIKFGLLWQQNTISRLFLFASIGSISKIRLRVEN